MHAGRTMAKAPSSFELFSLLVFVTMLQGWSLGDSQFLVCNSPPETTDDSTNAWHSTDQTVHLQCSAPPNCGCSVTKYCIADYSTSYTNSYFLVSKTSLIEDLGSQWRLYDHDTERGWLAYPENDPRGRNSVGNIVYKVSAAGAAKVGFTMGGRDWRGIGVFVSPDAIHWESAGDICCYGYGDYFFDVPPYSPFYLNFTFSTGSCCGTGSSITLDKGLTFDGAPMTGQCNPSATGTSVSITCPPNEVCKKVVLYYSEDSFGKTGAYRSSSPIKIDKIAPNVSAYVSPAIFSPNNDGSNDHVRIYYNLSDNSNPPDVRVVVQDAPPSVASVLVDEPLATGNYSVIWNGIDKYGRSYDHKFVYTVTVTDFAGNSNSASGFVVVDLSGPEFIGHSISSGTVELGDQAFISATLADVSGVDSVFACKSNSNCRNAPLEQYCRMEDTTGYRDKFSCNFTASGAGTYPYYLFANDSQNIFSNASGSFRIRNVSVLVDNIAPRPVDLQSSVTIKVNYTEDSLPVAGASCIVSGDISGVMDFGGAQYSISAHPAKLGQNYFAVTCSDSTHPSRSVSGSFLSRDLNVMLGFEFDPLAKDLDNTLYAYVSTVNDYSRVENADIRSFSITGPDGFSRTGDFGWNPATKRWTAVFTPPYTGAYAASAEFRTSGGISGSANITMVAEKGFELSKDISGSLSVDMGSSGLANILVGNRRKTDVSYNITLIGDLYPVSFDGQALSSRRYKTLAFVPAGTLQSHPLLVRGLEVSPFAKEVRIQFTEAQPPFDSANITLNYVVVSALDNRKFAPDLSFFGLLALLSSGALLLAHGKYFKI